MHLNTIFTELAESVGRGIGNRGPKSDNPKYKGKFGTKQFFKDLNAGDLSAEDLLEKKNYKYAWDNPQLRGLVTSEIERNAARFHSHSPEPKFHLTLSWLSRPRSNSIFAVLIFGTKMNPAATVLPF